jgi:hypothetical protein
MVAVLKQYTHKVTKRDRRLSVFPQDMVKLSRQKNIFTVETDQRVKMLIYNSLEPWFLRVPPSLHRLWRHIEGGPGLKSCPQSGGRGERQQNLKNQQVNAQSEGQFTS